jgi:hypothetical protein
MRGNLETSETGLKVAMGQKEDEKKKRKGISFDFQNFISGK